MAYVGTFPRYACGTNSPAKHVFYTVSSTAVECSVCAVKVFRFLRFCVKFHCICSGMHYVCMYVRDYYEPSPFRFHFENIFTGKYSISASHPTWDVTKVCTYSCVHWQDAELAPTIFSHSQTATNSSCYGHFGECFLSSGPSSS